MKRLAAALALSTLAIASGTNGAPAHQKDWTAPYAGAYTLQGDTWNRVAADSATGTVSAFRANPVPGSFGCGGQAGFAYVKTDDFTLTSDATHIGFNYEEAILSPYSWLKVTMVGPDGYIATGSFRGVLDVLPGAGAAEFALLNHQKAAALAGTPVHLEVGIETASACPHVDGGMATITSIWVA